MLENNIGFKYDHAHLVVFLVFFWTFWAALSWAFCWTFLSLVTFFLYPCFLAMAFFFLSLIYLIASSAKAFLSSGLAVFIFLIASRETPSMALSILRALCLLAFPVSDCLIFLCNLLHAVVHLSLWALSFLSWYINVPQSKVSSSLWEIEERSSVLSDISDTLSWIYFPFAEAAQFSFNDHNV